MAGVDRIKPHNINNILVSPAILFINPFITIPSPINALNVAIITAVNPLV